MALTIFFTFPFIPINAALLPIDSNVIDVIDLGC